MRTILPIHKRAAQSAPAHRVPAWPGRPNADEPISFADIRRLPEPEWVDRNPNEPEPHVDLMPGLINSAATVRTLCTVYDVVATEAEALLSELAELAPFAAELKARVA